MSPQSFDEAEDPLLAAFAGLDLPGIARSWQSPFRPLRRCEPKPFVPLREIKYLLGSLHQALCVVAYSRCSEYVIYWVSILYSLCCLQRVQGALLNAIRCFPGGGLCTVPCARVWFFRCGRREHPAKAHDSPKRWHLSYAFNSIQITC